MSRRSFLCILSVFIVLSLLSGCETGDDRSTSLSESSTSETLPIVMEELPPIDITMGLVTYVYSSKPLSVPGYASKVDEMLAKLNKKAQDDGLNITLKIK